MLTGGCWMIDAVKNYIRNLMKWYDLQKLQVRHWEHLNWYNFVIQQQRREESPSHPPAGIASSSLFCPRTRSSQPGSRVPGVPLFSHQVINHRCYTSQHPASQVKWSQVISGATRSRRTATKFQGNNNNKEIKFQIWIVAAATFTSNLSHFINLLYKSKFFCQFFITN